MLSFRDGNLYLGSTAQSDENRDVVDQLVGEYEWTLGELTARGLA